MAVKVTGGLPIKVVLIDQNGDVIDAAHPLIANSPIANQVVYNITLTLANTEYTAVLPALCRMYEFQARSEAVVRWSETAGRVAGPIAPYQTLKAGDYYYSPMINYEVPHTLYFASPTAGTVVELIVWY